MFVYNFRTFKEIMLIKRKQIFDLIRQQKKIKMSSLLKDRGLVFKQLSQRIIQINF